MFRLFSQNNPAAYAALLALLVALRGRLIYDPGRYVVADTPDLFSPLWQQLTGHVAAGSGLAVLLAVAVTFLCALMVNNMVNRYNLVGQQGVLGGMAFVILCGAFRLSLAFQPSFVFALALIWGLDRLFSATGKERPNASVAWGFAIVSAGSLIWAKGLVFIPFLFVLLFLLRVNSLRCVMAGVVGVVGVALVATTFTLFAPDPAETARSFARSGFATLPYWRLGPASITYLVVALGSAALAAASAQRHILEVSITVSRRVRAAEWVFFFTVFLAILPGFSLDIQILTAIGASMLLPRLLWSLGERGREALPAALTAVTAWIIYA